MIKSRKLFLSEAELAELMQRGHERDQQNYGRHREQGQKLFIFSVSRRARALQRVLLPWKFFPEDFEEVDSQDTLKLLEERSDEENYMSIQHQSCEPLRIKQAKAEWEIQKMCALFFLSLDSCSMLQLGLGSWQVIFLIHYSH